MNVRKNRLEWSVFAAALLIVVGCIALLVIQMIRSGDRPASLVISTGAATQEGTGYRVPVRVQNAGDHTAAGVQLRVVLEERGREVGHAELTIPFVPPQSSREGAVVFQRDPACCAIVVRALAFETP